MSMQEKSIGQDIKDVAVQDSTNKESRRRSEKRPAISAKHQCILDFLCACSPYEADSIRVMVVYATGKGNMETIQAVDMMTINRFLNTGINKQGGVTAEDMRRHRQTCAQKLMEAVKEFVNIDQFCRVSAAMMQITHDSKSIEECLKHLQSQNTPTSVRS